MDEKSDYKQPEQPQHAPKAARGAAAPEPTQKVLARTLTGQARNRGDQSVGSDWTELEVTQQQLAELKADDQILVKLPGQKDEEVDPPRNIMHAAFDPALAAMHPERLAALHAQGGGQLPPASLQTATPPAPAAERGAQQQKKT